MEPPRRSQTQPVRNYLVKRTSTFTNVPLQRLLSRLREGSTLEYKPLAPRDIRIICLQPGQFGKPLRCRLRHIKLRSGGNASIWARLKASLDVLGDYEAISYVWGKGDFDHELEIDGHVVPITESLYQALQHFRTSLKERRLWADAVCIDQTNVEERATQVAIFATIFRSASKVLVWLGPSQDGDAAAFVALNTLGRRRHHTLRPESSDLTEMLSHLEGLAKCPCCREATKIVGKDPESYLEALVRLLNRAYFTRMWIIQEVLSATSVEIWSGSHKAPWKQFLFLLGAMQNAALQSAGSSQGLGHHLNDCAHKLSDLSSIFLPGANERHTKGKFWVGTVLNHMSAFSSFDCSEPKDRIFAVRPMLQIEGMDLLKPDYKLDCCNIYRRLVRICMAQNHLHCRSYEFLALVGTERSKIVEDSASSWVPNFHSFSERSRLKHRQYSCQDYRDISTFRAEPLEFKVDNSDFDGRKLRVRGRVVGTITTIWEDTHWPILDAQSDPEIADDVKKIADWYRLCRGYATGCISLEQDALIFLTRGFHLLQSNSATKANSRPRRDTLLQDDFSEVHTDPNEETPAFSCGDSLAFLISRSVVPEAKRALYGMHVLMDPKQVMCEVELGASKTLAWVPSRSRIGDRLCVLAGAPYPFMVRGDPDAGCELLGDVYVQILTMAQVFGEKCVNTVASAESLLTDWNHRRAKMAGLKEMIEELGWITMA